MKDMFDVIDDIKEALKTHPDHRLNKTQDYFANFSKRISEIQERTMILSSKAKRRKLLTKLQLGKVSDLQQYYQAVCEIMLWSWFAEQGYKFETDKKISDENHSDVDIQVRYDDWTFNIEVKCPIVQASAEKGSLVLSAPFRTVEKNKFDEKMESFCREVLEPAIQKTDSGFKDIRIEKNNDNKLVEYLRSAQTKFKNSDEKTLNILFVGLPLNQMEYYYGYLKNGYTGIFTGRNPIMRAEEYNKTDIVVLSSMVEGHLYCDNSYDPWDLKNYFNLFLRNPHTNTPAKYALYAQVLKMIPNDTIRFDEFFDTFYESPKSKEKAHKVVIPAEILIPLIFSHYLDQYYTKMWRRQNSAQLEPE